MELVVELRDLLLRDLKRLKKEIELFNEESNMWKTSGDIKNSSGNLCLHLTGNLQFFIGSVLGKTGYERNREYEFSARDVSREKLIAEIETTIQSVDSSMTEMGDDVLNSLYPMKVLGYEMSTAHFCIHLQGHLNYHLGQINYLRRVLEG